MRILFKTGLITKPGIVKYIQNGRFSKQIIFSFSNTRLVHFGDQLFFLPVALLLRELNFKVLIIDPGQLTSLWEHQGFTVLSQNEICIEGALWISKDDMLPNIFPQLKNLNGHFLGFNFGKMKGHEAISKLIAKVIINMLIKIDPNIKISDDEINLFFERDYSRVIVNENAKQVKAEYLYKLDQVSKQKIIIFSDFVDSGMFQSALRRKHLHKLAQKLKAEYSIVYIGSKKEKTRRKPIFIDIDLRGETLTSEVFNLFYHPSVVGYAGFDTYPLHVATLCKKFLYVVKKSSSVNEKKFIPFIPGHEHLVKIIL